VRIADSLRQELFGPLSLRALEEDRYVRQTEGYLPSAHIVFLDEVFKANSAILNALLTLMNERAFDNGAERQPVPLLCLVAASNELPETVELDALYDRFLLRLPVAQVSNAGLRELLLLAAAPPAVAAPPADGLVLDAALLADLRATALREVVLPDSVLDLLCELRSFLQEEHEPPIYVSDRRLVKAVSLLRVSAYTCGRASVSETDLLLLEHVLWTQPEEAESIRNWLIQRFTRTAGTAQLDHLYAGLFGRACRASGRADDCKYLAVEARSLRLAVASQLRGGIGDDLRSHLWLSAVSAARIAQTLEPALATARAAQESLLSDIITLEVWLEGTQAEVHTLALLQQRRWAAWLGTAPIAEVRPLGVGTVGTS